MRFIYSNREFYVVEIDTDPLRETAASLQQYYSGLAEQLEAEEEEPDWMFM
jgi:predicted ATP-grasp superfamily ATP-dependent carboligase